MASQEDAGKGSSNPRTYHANDAASIMSAAPSTATTVPPPPYDSATDPLLPNAAGSGDSKNPASQPTPVAGQQSRRPGADIMASSDPSTAALRAWAQEKMKQHPGQDGSFATGAVGTGADGMGWGADSWILPQKGEKEREWDRQLQAEKGKKKEEQRRKSEIKSQMQGADSQVQGGERKKSIFGGVLGLGKERKENS